MRKKEKTGEVTVAVRNGQASFVIQSLHRLHPGPELRKQPAMWLAAMLTVILLAAPGHASIPYSSQDIISATNTVRQANGVAALTTNATLSKAAAAKAQDMIANNYFAHTSPTGTSPWYWFKQAGYSFTEAGENLAKDFASADGVVQGWMGSDSHRKNLLNAQFIDIGVAVVEGEIDGQSTIIVVQFFGSQKVAVAEPAPDPTPASQPAPTPAPTPTPTVQAPAPSTTQAPTEPAPATPVTPTIHSLISDDPVPVPTLAFTLQDPLPELRQPRILQPRVEGAESSRLAETTVGPLNPGPVQKELPLLMLVVFLTDFLAVALFGYLRPKHGFLFPIKRFGFRTVLIRP